MSRAFRRPVPVGGSRPIGLRTVAQAIRAFRLAIATATRLTEAPAANRVRPGASRSCAVVAAEVRIAPCPPEPHPTAGAVLPWHQRDRFRRRQGDVAARPVMDVAVPVAAAELPPVRRLAFEDRGEGVGIDRTGKPERRRAPASPSARFLVSRVILGVIPVALVVARTLRRRGDLANRRYHRSRTPMPVRPCRSPNSMP